jgi:hypothetical protein
MTSDTTGMFGECPTQVQALVADPSALAELAAARFRQPANGEAPCSLHCKRYGGATPDLPAAPDATKLSELQVERQLDLGLRRRRHIPRDHLSARALIPPESPVIGSVRFSDRLTIVPWVVICPPGRIEVVGHWASTLSALAVDTNVQTTPTRPTCSPLRRRLPENTTSSPRLKPEHRRRYLHQTR